MQVINKKLIVIFICLSIISFGLFKLFNKEKVVLDDVKLDIRDTNNSFAIYLENGYESNNYLESSNNEFPKIGYQFNKEKSQCVSIDGDVIDNILSYDNETNKVIVDTTDSVNCYLYFDRLTLGEAIKVLKPHGLNLDVTSDSDEWTGMYRFQGQQSENIENYICFGTTENCNANDETRDEYMYRIIGIEESGRIKVIKKEALEETEQWWSDYDTNVYWNESLIFEHINGEKFLNKEELIPNGWQDKIDTNNWLFGSMNSNNTTNGANQNGVEVYKIESGEKETVWDEKAEEGESYKGIQAKLYKTPDGPYKDREFYYIEHTEKWSETTLPHEVDAKIGLMNLSDYYLSVNNDVNCYNNTGCSIGWMHLLQNDTNPPINAEYTMTRLGWNINRSRYGVIVIFSSIGISPTTANDSLSIRPVFFLKNNIHLIDGKGTIDEPFIIN